MKNSTRYSLINTFLALSAMVSLYMGVNQEKPVADLIRSGSVLIAVCISSVGRYKSRD